MTLRHAPQRATRRRRAKWGCLLVLLLLAAVCCAAPLASTVNAVAALAGSGTGDDDDGLAESGTSADIPARMLSAYKNAVRLIGHEVPKCRGMAWPVLAGIAKVESNHASGRSIAKSGDITPRIYGVLLNGSGVGGNTSVFADTDGGKWDGTAQGERAVGPFQFLPSTWNGAGRDANKDGERNPHNADDAALGAAVYLCGRGRNLNKTSQLRAAILQYNHSTEYVNNVSNWIKQYRAAANNSSKGVDLSRVSGKAKTALQAALSQRGERYSWGGGNAKGRSTGSCCSPSGKSGAGIKGFDCAGLTQYAYAQAGVRLPRPASAQAGHGRRISSKSDLKPGDLVFYAYAPGRDSTIYHVGIYVGDGQMINAARPGTRIRLDPVDAMTGFAGGARLV